MSEIVLTIRTLFGKTLKLEVKTSDTIKMVKAKIAEEWKISPEMEMGLCFKESGLLQDEHTLAHYKIEKNMLLCIVFKSF